FDPKSQRIDVSGEHKFVPPGPKDYRGPCPGLNALANHNYIPRNGVSSIEQLINASVWVFGMSEDQASLAAYYSTAFAASPDLNHISIGAALNGEVAPDPNVRLRIPPQGLNFPHTGLEHDASATRLDKYQTEGKDDRNGNSHDLSLPLFEQLLDRQKKIAGHKVNYNIKILADHRLQRHKDSASKDSLFFLQPFGGLFLNGNKYALIYRAFANHSVDHPMGRLDRNTLMSFFGVEKDGTRGRGRNKLRYNKGGERIPDFWYRRPFDSPYDLKKSTDDLLEMARYHPELIDKYGIGGNVQGVNSHQVISIEVLTNGSYTRATIRDGYNLPCLGFLASAQLAPNWLTGYYEDFGTTVVPRLLAKLPPLVASLNCSRL
ncbi:Cloroperoxidase, partial [Lentithecium fluviatile CBS 122367]